MFVYRIYGRPGQCHVSSGALGGTNGTALPEAHAGLNQDRIPRRHLFSGADCLPTAPGPRVPALPPCRNLCYCPPFVLVKFRPTQFRYVRTRRTDLRHRRTQKRLFVMFIRLFIFFYVFLVDLKKWFFFYKTNNIDRYIYIHVYILYTYILRIRNDTGFWY